MQPSSDHPKARVLLVDDNEALARTTRRVLRGLGYHVEVAINGALAWAHLLASRALPCIVVSDFHMPEMTGGELIRRLRADVRLAGIPVLVTTGGEPNELPDDVPVLRKPYSCSQLAELISRHVDAHHARGDCACMRT